MTPPAPPTASTLLVLGAPGTGAAALCTALAAHPAARGLRMVCGEEVRDIAAAAAGWHRGTDCTTVLLMGLDLPCAASARAAQEACDARLRRALAEAGTSYRVVYGDGSQRIANAIRAIKNIAVNAIPTSAEAQFNLDSGTDEGRFVRLRAWNCEKCSDPECEHRLFTGRTGRSAVPGT